MLIPDENARELVEIPEDIKSNLDIRPVKWIDQVLDIALRDRRPAPTSRWTRAQAGIVRRRPGTTGSERSDHALIEVRRTVDC